jgi:glycosyltransferase involved in cell wall biosynthesis
MVSGVGSRDETVMKILQVHNFYKIPGGECSVVRAEKTLMESHGHQVAQFVRHSGDIEKRSILNNTASFLQIPYNLQSAQALTKFILHSRPDVAHVHNVFPLLSLSIYEALSRHHIPVVQTVHNFRFLCPNGQFFTHGQVCERCQIHGFTSAIKYKCMRNSTLISMQYAAALALAWRSGNLPNNIGRFVALNQFVADKLVKGGIPADRVRICGNFVCSIDDAPLPKHRYILYLGRLSPEKGLKTLLKAMETVPNLLLKIAGNGPMEEELQAIIKSNPALNVELTGHVSGTHKRQLIREALCTVAPSEWYENFPISVLESLAAGTPVIASCIGGLPEMISDGITGLLFPPGDAAQLAEKISSLANRPEQAERMATNAIQEARERFGPETHYQKLLAVYQELAPAD